MTDEQIAEANRRLQACTRLADLGRRVTKEDHREAAEELGISLRSFEGIWSRYRKIGTLSSLLPGVSSGGRGRFRVPEESVGIIHEVLKAQDRDRPKATDKQNAIFARAVLQQRNAYVPSLPTVLSIIAGVPTRERLKRKFGAKAASALFEPRLGKTPEQFYPLQQIQIDHTMVDIVCASRRDRRHVGRPWITVAIDECTRAIVGFVLSFEAPSATTVALCLQRAVMPKGDWATRIGLQFDYPMYGIPDAIFVDNANEFHGEPIQYGCAEYRIPPPLPRPAGQPHFGGIIERLVGVLMFQMRLLSGSTVRERWPREITANPNESAEMTIEELELWLATFIAGEYHRKPHGHTGQNPNLAWERGIYGVRGDPDRPGRGLPRVPEDERKFFLDFLPIATRTIQRNGIRWDNLTYWHEALRPYLDSGDQREHVVRRNAHDVSKIYFREPSGEYLEVPCTELGMPPITLWELREANQEIRAQRDKPDDESILRSVLLRRQIEDEAASDKKRVTARRNRERKDHSARLTADALGPVEATPKAERTSATEVRDDLMFEIDE